MVERLFRESVDATMEELRCPESEVLLLLAVDAFSTSDMKLVLLPSAVAMCGLSKDRLRLRVELSDLEVEAVADEPITGEDEVLFWP